MQIRTEQGQDHQQVFALIKKAFEQEEYTDHKEQYLVERLRKSDAFIKELSLVALLQQRIVGYVLLTEITLKSSAANQPKLLALAPLAVDPAYQRKGIGGELIKAAHHKAKELGYAAIVILGHPQYYPKFGYQKSILYGITLPFEVPQDNAMLIELIPHALQGIQGEVKYAREFDE